MDKLTARFLDVAFVTFCRQCRKPGIHIKDSITQTKNEALYFFNRDGWRVTKDNEVLCPECSKKKEV